MEWFRETRPRAGASQRALRRQAFATRQFFGRIRDVKNYIYFALLVLPTLVACRRAEPPTPPVATDVEVPLEVAVAPPAPDATEEPAPPAVDPDATLTLWDAIKKERLDNGLTSYVMHHGHPKGRAYVWLAVNAGSVQEEDSEQGLAHLVEHMAFSGTKRFPGSSVVTWAESIGMRFGADVNAYTSFDVTVYQLEVPTDDPKHLLKALDILRDWAADISFEEAPLQRERGVVLEERRLRRGVGERVFEAHLPVLFKGTRYAERLPIGKPEVIEKAPRDVLLGFYRKWYRPDLMAVMVVGDIDANATVEAVRERFKDLKNPDTETPRTPGGQPDEGLRVSVVRDAELPRATISWFEFLPHRPEGTARDYRRGLADGVWQIILQERLAQLGRKPDAPFEGAGFSIDSPMRDFDALSAQVLPKPGRLLEAFKAILIERRRAEVEGFNTDEIVRARAQLERFYEDYDLGLATTESNLFSDEMTRNFFEGELMVGAAREKKLALEALAALTSEEIAASGRVFSKSQRRAVLVSAPEDETLPDEAAIRAVIAEVAAMDDLVRPEATAALGALVTTPPAGGKIVAESRFDAVDTTVWTLDNGIKVLVKVTDFEIDAVTIDAVGPGGYAAVADADWAQARFALSALSQGGLGDHDVIELGKLLAGRSAQASVFVGDTTEGINAGGSVRDLETILQLVWLSATAPRVDPEAVTIWKDSYATRLDAERRQPETRYAIELAEVMSSSHPRARWPTPEGVQAVDMDKALAFHKARFGDMSDLTFVIVGAVDLKTLRPLVEKWIGSLPGGGRVETETDIGVRMPGKVFEKTWRLGKEDKAQVQVILHADEAWDRDSDRDLRILADVLGVRLREVLREDLGGVYGVQVSGSFDRRPREQRALSIRFGCAPGRVDELVAATFKEIDRIAAEGAGPEILARLKEQAACGREIQLRNNDVWAGWLLSCERFGDEPERILDPEPYYARLNDQFVKAAAKRFGDRKQMFKAVLLPEAK